MTISYAECVPEQQAGSGDAYLVNIHTDVDTLMAEGEGATSEQENGGRVSAETPSG